jgi:hypothetical protein
MPSSWLVDIAVIFVAGALVGALAGASVPRKIPPRRREGVGRLSHLQHRRRFTLNAPPPGHARMARHDSQLPRGESASVLARLAAAIHRILLEAFPRASRLMAKSASCRGRDISSVLWSLLMTQIVAHC